MGFWLIMLQQPGAHIATKLHINIQQVEQKGNPIKLILFFYYLWGEGGWVGGGVPKSKIPNPNTNNWVFFWHFCKRERGALHSQQVHYQTKKFCSSPGNLKCPFRKIGVSNKGLERGGLRISDKVHLRLLYFREPAVLGRNAPMVPWAPKVYT